VIDGAYDLGALAATDEAIGVYERHGWRRWTGPLSVLTPRGITPTPDERGAIFVLGDTLDRTRELTCDWRDGDVW
jgi:aminoglycoside 2'-N-acetyltransferase I